MGFGKEHILILDIFMFHPNIVYETNEKRKKNVYIVEFILCGIDIFNQMMALHRGKYVFLCVAIFKKDKHIYHNDAVTLWLID